MDSFCDGFLLFTLPTMTRLLCLAPPPMASTVIATRPRSESLRTNLSCLPWTKRKRLMRGLTVSFPTLIVTRAGFEEPPSLPTA